VHKKYDDVPEMDRNYTAVGKLLVILAVGDLILSETKKRKRRRKSV
jgi:hypothetical protein